VISFEPVLSNIGKGISDITQPQPKMYSREEVENFIIDFNAYLMNAESRAEKWIKENLK
jgi:hypothetical protein